LEHPWTFRELTEEQAILVTRLRAGEDVGVLSVPADRPEQSARNDALMAKERMTRKRWETLSDEEKDRFSHALDFEQYAPFETDGSPEPLFTLTLHAGIPGDLEASREEWTRVVAVEEAYPYYYGYTCEDRIIYEYFPAPGIRAGFFVLEKGFARSHYYPTPGISGRATLMQVNTSLMIHYTFATAGLDTVLLHASVTRYRGRGNLFFGVSGTGKSTHSRLWHEYVPGTDLMNDDNPILRFVGGEALVYGSPWSGKTLCYRNVQAPVGALVRLEQAPENRIVLLEALHAYASVVAAVSTIRWNHAVMDLLVPTVERIAMNLPCFRLQCRPDEEAVQVCKQAIDSIL